MALPVRRSDRSLARWDPFREFEDLYSQMRRLMESSLEPSGVAAGWAPFADISETDDAYVVEVELPGVKREDLNIELAGNELVISGEVKESERAGMLRKRTRRIGNFEYRAFLPRDVNADHIEAQLHDGVLTVRVPKSEAAKPRRIEITGG